MKLLFTSDRQGIAHDNCRGFIDGFNSVRCACLREIVRLQTRQMLWYSRSGVPIQCRPRYSERFPLYLCVFNLGYIIIVWTYVGLSYFAHSWYIAYTRPLSTWPALRSVRMRRAVECAGILSFSKSSLWERRRNNSVELKDRIDMEVIGGVLRRNRLKWSNHHMHMHTHNKYIIHIHCIRKSIH